MSELDDAALAALAAEQGLGDRAADPLAWFRWPSENHRKIARSLCSENETYVRSPNQAAKAQPLSEPVLTPGGWSTMGMLRPGDAVIACDGSPATVLSVHPQGLRPVYRMVFNDRTSVRCTLDHLWRVRTSGHRFGGRRGFSVLTLGEIIARWGDRPSRFNAISIPPCGAVEFPESVQPLDPYLVGVLLGDGSTSGKSTVGLSSVDEDVLQRVRESLPEGVHLRQSGSGCDWRITTGRIGGSPSTRTRNTALVACRQLGMMGKKSWQKRIPEQYLVASVEQRLALLQGLMDTDGTVSERGAVTFCTTSEALRDGMLTLVRSLGGRAWALTRHPSYTHKGQRRFGLLAWNITIHLPGRRMFHLSRKHARVKESIRTMDRVLVEVVPDGFEQCQCIAVDHPSHTYVTRDFVVTHNTTTAANICVALARGRAELDGEPLPVLGTPNTGAHLVHSYKIASGSSLPALEDALGDRSTWKALAGSQGTTLGYLIRPIGSRSDNPKTWSRLMVWSEDGPKPEGIRLDYAWPDEPPDWEYWLALRGRGRANRPFIRLLTATPLDMVRWMPLREEFTGHEYPGRDGLCEIRLKLTDNRFLSADHIAKLDRMWRGKDPQWQAKLNGDYVNATSLCPFDAEGLDAWEAQAQEGDAWKDDPEVRVWGTPDDAHEEFFVVVDLSAGIDDGRGKHDPACIIVGSRSRPRLCARWNGYRKPYLVGRLAAKLAKLYNDAMVVHEQNSGYGDPFQMGCEDEGYQNFYLRHHTDRVSGIVTKQIGWTTTISNRGTIIGALQKLIEDRDFPMPCRTVVDNLRWIGISPENKYEATSGHHDEDMIVFGLYAHLLQSLPVWARPKKRSEMSQIEQLNDMDRQHEREEERDPFSVW